MQEIKFKEIMEKLKEIYPSTEKTTLKQDEKKTRSIQSFNFMSSLSKSKR